MTLLKPDEYIKQELIRLNHERSTDSIIEHIRTIWEEEFKKEEVELRFIFSIDGYVFALEASTKLDTNYPVYPPANLIKEILNAWPGYKASQESVADIIEQIPDL